MMVGLISVGLMEEGGEALIPCGMLHLIFTTKQHLERVFLLS